MERGSSKHGPILDEEMAKEAQAHTQGAPGGSRMDEARLPEPAGEDQPEPTLIPGGDRPEGAPAPLTGEELEQRSELGRWLPRSVFPADRGALVTAAEESGAPVTVLAQLDRLPADRAYATVYEVWEGLGHRNEPTSGDPSGGRPAEGSP